MSKRLNLEGKHFGRLTVGRFAYVKNGKAYWRCICDCGNETVVQAKELNNGHTKSCGCLQKDIARQHQTKHGYSKTRLYRIWNQMKERCLNPNDSSYQWYGKKGITVCDEWKNNFARFRNWAIQNGYTDDLTIDRIDVYGNYEPSNCRWITMKEQIRNKRTNILVEFNGREMCLADAARLSGISKATLHGRYHRGDSGERLFRPVRKLSK